jgi:hypothetical protein
MWYNQYFGDRRIGWLYKFFLALDFPTATPEEKKNAIRLLKKVLVTTNLANTDINNLNMLKKIIQRTREQELFIYEDVILFISSLNEHAPVEAWTLIETMFKHMFKYTVIYDEEISDFEICLKHLEQILIRICSNGTDVTLPDEKKGAFKKVAAIAKEVLSMISRGGDIIDRGKMPSSITDHALQQIFKNNLDNLICMHLLPSN